MGFIVDLIADISLYLVREVFMRVFHALVWSRNCGLSSALRKETIPHEGIRESGSLINDDIKRLSQYVFSDNFLEAALGIAATKSDLPIERD